MMRTNCEQFADRGDAMDSRVPLNWGLGDAREPRRFHARHHPDGSLDFVPSRDFFSWNELPAPERYVAPKCHEPKPVRPAVDEARARFNHRMRARARYRELMRDESECEAIECLKKVDEPRAERHVQTRDEWQAWLEEERAEMRRRRNA